MHDLIEELVRLLDEIAELRFGQLIDFVPRDCDLGNGVQSSRAALYQKIEFQQRRGYLQLLEPSVFFHARSLLPGVAQSAGVRPVGSQQGLRKGARRALRLANLHNLPA